MTGDGVERRLAAIMSADVAGYSRLMGKDEAGTLAALWVCLNESRFSWVEDRDRSFEKAEELARRAVAVDEASSVGHNLLSRIYSLQRQYEQAIAEGERTVAIEPSSASAYASLAWTMALAGRPKDGLALIRKALRLRPYARRGCRSDRRFSTAGTELNRFPCPFEAGR